jgi:hypothetical protein
MTMNCAIYPIIQQPCSSASPAATIGYSKNCAAILSVPNYPASAPPSPLPRRGHRRVFLRVDALANLHITDNEMRCRARGPSSESSFEFSGAPRLVGTMSAGEKRRALTAATVLDEPSNAFFLLPSVSYARPFARSRGAALAWSWSLITRRYFAGSRAHQSCAMAALWPTPARRTTYRNYAQQTLPGFRATIRIGCDAKWLHS